MYLCMCVCLSVCLSVCVCICLCAYVCLCLCVFSKSSRWLVDACSTQWQVIGKPYNLSRTYHRRSRWLCQPLLQHTHSLYLNQTGFVLLLLSASSWWWVLTVWRPSVCPMTAKTSIHGKTGGLSVARGESLVSAAADMRKWCRKNPVLGHCSEENLTWLRYAASGNVVFCLKTTQTCLIEPW